MNGKLFIKEDITDWRDEALRDELIFNDESAIVDALAGGKHTAQIARAALVSREMKELEEEALRPNKVLLNVGAQMDVIGIAHKQKTSVKTSTGDYIVNSLVGAVREKEEKPDPEADASGNGEEPPDIPEASFVQIEDPRAFDRAVKYLETIVPGHIWNRLLVIHASSGDVRNEADKLKSVIDEMVGRIV